MTDTHAPTIEKREGGRPRPLSSAQERLFLLDRIMPGLGVYNVPTLVRVGTALDEDVLRRAFAAVAARHEILRTSIALVDGEPVQEVMDRTDVELAVLDVRGRAEGEADAEAERFLGELAARPFDLSGDVLLRAGLVHVAPDEELLLVVFHHAASDHRSGSILFAELNELYDAYSAGRQPELPELLVQYADYAEWQREQLADPQFEELVDYWKKQLAGAPSRLELPTDRPRPSVQSYRGRHRDFPFAARLGERLREFARAQRVSPYMVLLAAFDVVVQRYTGADDLVIGTPISGRHHEELEPLLGYFSNTLALRSDLSGDPTFSELLQRLRVTTLEAQMNQDLPFERLVEMVNPERSQSHSPIFQILFGFDVAPESPPTLAGQELRRQPIPGWGWSRFEFSIICRDTYDGGLRADVEYASDLFDEVTVDRFMGHFETLLTAAMQNPEQQLSRLPLLTEAERDETLVHWNDTSAGYDARPLHELVREIALRSPDPVAVIDADSRISYADLERRSNQVAHRLLALGVERGGFVGLCLDRTVDLPVAMLGVLKTGAAYVPIDPTYPPHRQELILADVAARVLLTHERYEGAVGGLVEHVLCLDRDSLDAESADPPAVEVSPEDLAYVIYTSGSTGTPKGVEIRHRSVANLMAYMREAPGLGVGDVLANVTTPAFDLSVPDWYLPLTTGARLVLVPREATLDAVDLADWLARSNATFMQATPTTWQMLVDAGWKGSDSLKIVCGGEPFPRALVGELLGRCSALWQMYGPTETTVWSSVIHLTAGEGPPPLGGPIANTTFYVLDEHGEPVPTGVPGELYIGGDGVARGYHERPELTAEKFVPSPFGEAVLYRTGDLVRRRHDGTLEFLERIDQQVKLRGFRIELGEIESVLAQVPGVAAAVAAVREDVPGDQRLVAYAVPAGGMALDVEELRRVAKVKLPPFMVPSTFVTLDSLPVTANGKLDRRALPAPDGIRPNLEGSYVAPRTPVEESLAAIWCAVLGINRVGVDDDFFDLGGHSLLAVKMLAQVQQTLGLDLALPTIFEHSTVHELAALVTVGLRGEAGTDELAELLAEVEASEP